MKVTRLSLLAIAVVIMFAAGETLARGPGGGGGGGRGGGGGGRPSMSRSPSMSRPSGGSSFNRSPSRPPSSMSRPSPGTRPSTPSRPATPSRPSTRPSTPSRPNVGAPSRPSTGPGTRPSTPGGGSRPSQGQLQDFLNLPGTGGPSAGTRPTPGERPSTLPARPTTRPSPGERPATRPGGPVAGTRPSPGNRPATRPGSPAAGNRPSTRPVRNPATREQRSALYHTRGVSVRSHGYVHARHSFGPGWYNRYPNLRHGRWGRWGFYRHPWRTWWRPAAWVGLTGWIRYAWSDPIYYDYGGNVYYENNTVYVDGQEVCSAAEYAEQIAAVADSVPEDIPEDIEWMSLGTFALVEEEQEEPTMFLQLAVSKDGIIGGTYRNTDTNSVENVEGMVDKASQRAAWTIGDNKDTVLETGICNLTEDETAVLVHFGPEQTQQWLLVRLEEPEEEPATGQPSQ